MYSKYVTIILTLQITEYFTQELPYHTIRNLKFTTPSIIGKLCFEFKYSLKER